jgi:hypothetical protein
MDIPSIGKCALKYKLKSKIEEIDYFKISLYNLYLKIKLIVENYMV